MGRQRSAGSSSTWGMAGGSFSFETMERAMEQGFFPDTISSDLHVGNVNGAGL